MGRRRGGSFSWRRASGLSSAKGKLSRQLGVPLTRSGRQRKLRRATGCSVLLLLIVGGVLAGTAIVATAISAWSAHAGKHV
jgi:hypothetical protein